MQYKIVPYIVKMGQQFYYDNALSLGKGRNGSCIQMAIILKNNRQIKFRLNFPSSDA